MTARQPKGIPAGGQYAPDVHAEPEAGLRPVARPIMATVDLQDWVNNYAITRESIRFDATRILAEMGEQERAALEDCSEEADEIYREAVRRGLVKDHDGPFDVYVCDALDEALEEDPEVLARAAAAPACRAPGEVLEEPLSAYEIGARADENGWVEGLAPVSLDELVDRDLEGHLDLLGERLVGSELLMDLRAKPAGVTADGRIILNIEGDASTIIDGFDDEQLADFEAGQAARAAQQATTP